MTEAQYRLYWREWKNCKAWFISHGFDPNQADAKRGKLTKEALGYELSMTNWPRWKNPELDKVLAKFRSVYDGGNLGAQMRAEDEPIKRKEDLVRRCFAAVSLWVSGDAAHSQEFIVRRYLNGVSERVAHSSFDSLDERGLQKICGVVEAQARRQKARAFKSGEVVNENPF